MAQADFDFYNVPILEYLLAIGEPIVPVSHNYFQHKEHDSLKINVRKNYFVWNSRLSEKNSRGGVIQYLQIVYGLSLKEALEKVKIDYAGIEIKEVKRKSYPKFFNYKVREAYIPLSAQKYLVFNRKIPNRIIKKFFSYNLISQNEKEEIVFKWYQGDRVVGFTKQGTIPLSEEEKEKYHIKRDYLKYVAPTTKKHTYWGFNYLEGEPRKIKFFESPIDLISYYTLHEKELEKNFWLISLDGLSREKILSFLVYGLENLDLKNCLETISLCFDNDKAGIEAVGNIQRYTFLEKEFDNEIPKKFKDWNEVLQKTK